jgi:hypothetical protein
MAIPGLGPGISPKSLKRIGIVSRFLSLCVVLLALPAAFATSQWTYTANNLQVGRYSFRATTLRWESFNRRGHRSWIVHGRERGLRSDHQYLDSDGGHERRARRTLGHAAGQRAGAGGRRLFQHDGSRNLRSHNRQLDTDWQHVLSAYQASGHLVARWSRIGHRRFARLHDG